MAQNSEIKTAEFLLKNRRLYAAAAVCAVFIAIGVWTFIGANSPALNINPLVVRVASATCALFFGVILAFCVKFIFSKRVGLKIDQSGITDTSNALSLGFIRRENIKEACVKNVGGEWLLMIYLNDPEKYLADENGYIARILRINRKNFGCEAAVKLGSLKCTNDEVEGVLRTVFTE